MSPLLKVRNLTTYFHTERGIVRAVEGVSYYIDRGEVVGLVGESGCGKTVSQLSVIQLVPPPGKIVAGEVFLEGQNLLDFDSKGAEMSSIRGRKIAMIFQEPMTSLNPVLTIGEQLAEAMLVHLNIGAQAARQRAAELLTLVGIPDAEHRLDDYPHQFSGGMRQRAMIAMALSCNPGIVIADEPTTAVDVTTQAQLLEVLKKMVTRFESALVIVTHNLGVVARYARRIYVMYAGHIVESGTSKEIFSKPRHPYTIGLLSCVPRLDDDRRRKLVSIRGMPPTLINMPATCGFLPRCQYSTEMCKHEPWPELSHVDGEHYCACYADTSGK